MSESELLTRLADWLEPPEETRRENRGRKRRALKCLAQVVRLATGEAMKLPLRDLSTAGIGVVVPTRWKQGERFVVSFGDARNSFLMLCQVAHCRTSGAQGYILGAEFLDKQIQTAGEECMPLKWFDCRMVGTYSSEAKIK